MVWSAAPEYYSCLRADHESALNFIQGQLCVPFSELAQLWLLTDGSDEIGLVAGVAAENIVKARYGALLAATRGLSKQDQSSIFHQMKIHAARVQPFSDAGFYLSRIAVHPAKQRCGFGHTLLDRLFQITKKEPVYLHVNCDNRSVVQFYEAEGFRRIPSAEHYDFQVWVHG